MLKAGLTFVFQDLVPFPCSFQKQSDSWPFLDKSKQTHRAEQSSIAELNVS